MLHKSSPSPQLDCNKTGRVYLNLSAPKLVPGQVYWRHQSFCPQPTPSIQCLCAQRSIIFINFKISVEQFSCSGDVDEEEKVQKLREKLSLLCENFLSHLHVKSTRGLGLSGRGSHSLGPTTTLVFLFFPGLQVSRFLGRVIISSALQTKLNNAVLDRCDTVGL